LECLPRECRPFIERPAEPPTTIGFRESRQCVKLVGQRVSTSLHIVVLPRAHRTEHSADKAAQGRAVVILHVIPIEESTAPRALPDPIVKLRMRLL
jgi:hypothetical protein